jgi:hypothetical protein
MNDIALRYRAELLRAVFGSYVHTGKVHDLHRLSQLAERLAMCEEAQAALHAKGYGLSGMTFTEVVRQVPDNSPGILKMIFRPAHKPPAHLDSRELFDIWSSR